MNTLKLFRSFIFILCIIFFASCGRSIDPSDPLNKKWKKVSSWISPTSTAIIVVDVHKMAGTEFYKNTFGAVSGRSNFILNGINPDTDAGIFVYADGLVFFGGRFDPDAVIMRIKTQLRKTSLAEEKYSGKNIYTDVSKGYSFSFLERYLLCYGKKDDIKKLISIGPKEGRSAIGFTEPTVIWGSIDNYSSRYIHLSFSKLTFTAEVDSSLHITAKTPLGSEPEALKLVDELGGIKALGSIKSLDDPYLADIIEAIDILRNGNVVSLKINMSVKVAKKLLETLSY